MLMSTRSYSLIYVLMVAWGEQLFGLGSEATRNRESIAVIVATQSVKTNLVLSCPRYIFVVGSGCLGLLCFAAHSRLLSPPPVNSPGPSTSQRNNILGHLGPVVHTAFVASGADSLAGAGSGCCCRIVALSGHA